MPTNSLGPNKVNLSCPLDVSEKRELMRKAFEADVSASSIVRSLVRKYLAGEIVLALGLVLFGTFAPVSFCSKSQSLQTVARRVRRGGRRNEAMEQLFAALDAMEAAGSC